MLHELVVAVTSYVIGNRFYDERYKLDTGKTNGMDFPGSAFHPLKGDRKGEYAVKVTGNYRITFKFNKKEGTAFDVNYEDYH